MIIRWKVTKDDRTSPHAEGKYYKEYLKNTIVKANKNTLGLMTFKTKEQAATWANRSVIRTRILKVRPIGRGKVPIVLANRDYFNLFYKHKRTLNSKKIAKLLRLKGDGRRFDYRIGDRDIILWPVPEGTVCYPAVEVLE